MKKLKKILVLSAHPDDEVLGLGATLAKYAQNNSEIHVLIFADGESARGDSRNIKRRKIQGRKAASIIGIKQIEFLGYKDQLLDTVPILKLVQKIEEVII